jgi:hypothetical protein
MQALSYLTYLNLLNFDHPDETWSLAYREEALKLRTFENRMLRRKFVPNTDVIKGGWRQLHSEELHNLYSSLNVIRMMKSGRMRWTRHIAHMGDKRNANRILVGNIEARGPLRRLGHRWENSIKIDFKEI